MLAQYLADLQNLLNDAGGQLFRPGTLINNINQARRRIAWWSQCIRVMPEGVQTVPGQEIYHFKDWIAQVQSRPGVREIHAVQTLSIALGGPGSGPGTWNPAWNQVDFSDFQARFRIWNRGFVGTIAWPGYWAQYGHGTAGSIYLWPIPSMAQRMELDCFCMPFPLETDDDPEALPMPWQDAVQYFAAFKCMLQQQRLQEAKAYLELFKSDMPEFASAVKPRMIVAPYGAAVRAV